MDVKGSEGDSLFAYPTSKEIERFKFEWARICQTEYPLTARDLQTTRCDDIDSLNQISVDIASKRRGSQ